MTDKEDSSQDVVIQQCDELRVFVNARGFVSVVQSGAFGEEDSVIDFPAQFSAAVCRAIRSAAKQAKEV